MIPESITKRDHQLAILQQEFLALSFEDISHGVFSKPLESNSSSRHFNMANTQRILTHKSKQQSFSSLTKQLNNNQSNLQPQPLTSLLHIKKTDSSKQRKIVRPGSSFKKDTLLEIEKSVAVKQAALDHSINEEIIGNDNEELNYFLPETNCIKYRLQEKQLGLGSKPNTPLGATSKNGSSQHGDNENIKLNEKSLGFSKKQPNLTISESSHCRLKNKTQSQQQLRQVVVLQGQQKQDNLERKQQKLSKHINSNEISARDQQNNLNQPILNAVFTSKQQQLSSTNNKNAQFSVRPHSGSILANFHGSKSKPAQKTRAIQQPFKEISIPAKSTKHSTQSTLIRHLLASERTNDNLVTRNYEYSVQIKEKVSKMQETKKSPQLSPRNYRDIEITLNSENHDEFQKYLQKNQQNYNNNSFQIPIMEDQYQMVKQQQFFNQANYLEEEIEQINRQVTNPLLSQTLEVEDQYTLLPRNKQDNFNSSQNQQKNMQRTIKFQQVSSSKPAIVNSSSSIYFPPKQQKNPQVIPFNLSDTLSRRKQIGSQISTDQMKKLLMHPELKDSFSQRKLPNKRPSSSHSQVTGISFLQNSGSFQVNIAVDRQHETQKYQNNQSMQNQQNQSNGQKTRPKSAQEQLFKGLILTGQKNYLPSSKHMRPQTAQQFTRQKTIEKNLNDSLKSWENSQIDEIEDPAEVGKKGRFSKTEIE